MVSGFHDRDNLLSTIILCMLKHLYGLTRPKKKQAYSTHYKVINVSMESRSGIHMVYVMHRYIIFHIYTHAYKIFSRTKCREHKLKIHLQTISISVNTQ